MHLVVMKEKKPQLVEEAFYNTQRFGLSTADSSLAKYQYMDKP